MIRFLISIASLVCLAGCISFSSREASLNSYDSKVLNVKLSLPTGERFMNPHGLVWTPKTNLYIVVAKRNHNKLSTDDFYIIANGKDLTIKSGTIKVNYLGNACELIIDIVTSEKEHLLINGSHKVELCNGT